MYNTPHRWVVRSAKRLSLNSSTSLALSTGDCSSLLILSKGIGSTMRSTMRFARLRQTKVNPVQASLSPKSITGMGSVCPFDVCIVKAQQSSSGSCALVIVLPSPFCLHDDHVASSGEMSTRCTTYPQMTTGTPSTRRIEQQRIEAGLVPVSPPHTPSLRLPLRFH